MRIPIQVQTKEIKEKLAEMKLAVSLSHLLLKYRYYNVQYYNYFCGYLSMLYHLTFLLILASPPTAELSSVLTSESSNIALLTIQVEVSTQLFMWLYWHMI